MCNVLLWSPPGHQTSTYHRENRGHDLSETYCNYDALLLIKAAIKRHPDINCEQQPATMLLGNENSCSSHRLRVPLTPLLPRDSTSAPTARRSTSETSSESFNPHWGGNSQLPHSRQTSAALTGTKWTLTSDSCSVSAVTSSAATSVKRVLVSLHAEKTLSQHFTLVRQTIGC